MAFEAVSKKIAEAKSSHQNFLKEIENDFIAILKEMQEQVPKKGLDIIKTPNESYTLTREGVKRGGTDHYICVDESHYSKLFTKLLGFFAYPNDDEFQRARRVSVALFKIAKDKGYKITGKYLQRK